MNIRSVEIEVEQLSINPMLNIWVNLEFEHSKEIPLSLSGKLCHNNGRILSVLQEYQLNTDSKYELTFKNLRKEESSERSMDRHSVQLSAVLTPPALEIIEREREKNTEKKVEFYIEFIFKTIILPRKVDLENIDSFELNIEKKPNRISIEQSDWVNNYSPKLGIGNFLLLELNLADYNNISDFWKELIEPLKNSVLEMEKWIRMGEWKKTIESARPFFEGLNFKKDTSFKEALIKILKKEQHNEEGIKDLQNAIQSLFNYTSKYVHFMDREGTIKPYPNAKKEDAYLVYTFSIGLLNLIGSKIQS